jgi:cytochrome c
MFKSAMICFSIASSVIICHGQVSDAAKKLALESESYCASTASTKPTADMVIAKVTEACALVEKEGTKSFAKFKGKNSKFIFAGTYIWINDLNGKMLMHPIKPAMEGQDLIGLKDSNGKRFFVDMIATVKEKGSGWVDYLWPKPGSTERSTKVSYVKKVICDGTEVLLGCGVYDITIDEVNSSAK